MMRRGMSPDGTEGEFRPLGSSGRNSEGFLPWQPRRQHAKY
jgi:hypothetical protein